MDHTIAGLATKQELAGVVQRSEARLKREMGELRGALNFYHSAVVGHGIHLTDLDTRLRRVEEKLGMASDA